MAGALTGGALADGWVPSTLMLAVFSSSRRLDALAMLPRT